MPPEDEISLPLSIEEGFLLIRALNIIECANVPLFDGLLDRMTALKEKLCRSVPLAIAERTRISKP
jgi:hypothetical protein